MIYVNKVSKTYRSGRGVIQVLTDVSFGVETGQALITIGKSGSGKTTLLHCIGGIERPDSGSVHCLGIDIHALSRRDLALFQRKQIGFVFQFGNLLSYLTVFENIAFPLTLNKITGQSQRRRVQELLASISLSGAGNAMPHELSGGEVQRVSFARAIAHSPKLLLADEPTASLDTETGLKLVHLMLAMSKEHNCTLVIATHDRELIKLGDTILPLSDGKVVDQS